MASSGWQSTRPSLLSGSGPAPAQQQQLSYGASEHAHMMAAIHQPLFIQTPLQVMLESLVERLQAQAGVIEGLQDKVSTLERRQLDGGELLVRLQLVEDRVAAAATATGSSCSSAVSPFVAADVLKRLAAVEQQAVQAEASRAQLAVRAEQVLEPRLQLCEQRLAGCHNIAGALMAVEAMAAELGIPVPHPALSTLSQLSGHVVHLPQQQQLGVELGPLSGATLTAAGAAAVQLPGHPAAAGGPGALTISRQQALQQQIDAGREQQQLAQQQLQVLQQQVERLASDAAASQDQQLGVLAGLQDGATALWDRLAQQVAAVRREMRPALQAAELQQLCQSEFTKLQSQVEAATAGTASVAQQLAALKAKELASVSASLAELTRRLNRVTGAAGGLSDTERALATAQAELRSEVAAISCRLSALEVSSLEAGLAGSRVASEQQQQETAGRTRDKASSGDMQAVVARAVALAVSAHMSSLDRGRDGAAASRSRCLVCERTLRDGSPPRCSTAPQPHAAAASALDALRPGIAAAGSTAALAAAGSSCCQQAGGVSCSSSSPGGVRSLRGGDAVAAAPCAVGPHGPGLMAAQHRQQLAAQRAGRPAIASSSRNGGAAAGRCSIVVDGRSSPAGPQADCDLCIRPSSQQLQAAASGRPCTAAQLAGQRPAKAAASSSDASSA